MAKVSSKLRNRIAAMILPLIALCGCATSDDTDLRGSTLYAFDVPRPLLAVYASEIDMLTTCKVGPISTMYDLSIDPRFDRDKQTATIAVIATGYFNPQTWDLIDLQPRGAVTHVTIFGERRPELENIGRDLERWANAGNGC